LSSLSEPAPLAGLIVNAKTTSTTRTDTGSRSQRRSLMELTDDTCQWPVGDPSTVDFFFCGAQPLPDKPYCAAHCARASGSTRPCRRRRRRRPTMREIDNQQNGRKHD
jgi:GcrA cell cycle regulator